MYVKHFRPQAQKMVIKKKILNIVKHVREKRANGE